MNTIYFPAIGGGSQGSALTRDYPHPYKPEFMLRPVGKNSLFNYEHMLISAAHAIDRKLNITNEMFDFDNGICLGDSGGYQIATGVMNFNDEVREKIFRWLEDNTNYAMNLDIPPWDLSISEVDEFDRRLSVSYDNYKYFYENQTGKTKFMNVLQGTNLDQLNKWYDKVKEFHFEGGWGVGGSAINIFRTLQAFFFLYEKGEVNRVDNGSALVHILGYSKASSLFVLIYLQQKLNSLGHKIRLSYDSSTPYLQSSYGRYSLFTKREGVTYITFNMDVFKEEQHVNLSGELPCNCNVCKGLTFKDLLSLRNNKGGFKSEWYLMLGNHNLNNFLKYKIQLESLISLENKDLLSTVFNTNHMRIFEIIDKCFEADSPTVYLNKHRFELASLANEPEIIRDNLF